MQVRALRTTYIAEPAEVEDLERVTCDFVNALVAGHSTDAKYADARIMALTQTSKFSRSVRH